jgi:hypothetical protein
MKLKTEGQTELERFSNAMQKLLSVSHEEMQRGIAADLRGHTKAKRKKAENQGCCFPRFWRFLKNYFSQNWWYPLPGGSTTVVQRSVSVDDRGQFR